MGHCILNICKLFGGAVLRVEEDIEVSCNNESPIFHCTCGITRILGQREDICKHEKKIKINVGALTYQTFQVASESSMSRKDDRRR